MRLRWGLILWLAGCGPATSPGEPGGPADAGPTEDGAVLEDAGATPDSGPLGDAGGATDAEPTDQGNPSDGGVPPTPACTARNLPEEIAARDGFVEVCADPTTQARAVCGDGSPYRFAYRPATGPSAGLLVFFQGGGACTDYVSCWGTDGRGGPGRRVVTMSNNFSGPTVLPIVNRTYAFFDQRDPTALFGDFDVLYAPYCSGDGGQGSREVTFQRPPSADESAPAEILTYFHGLDNQAAIVAFGAAQFTQVTRLVIAGSSAGAYASLAAVPGLVSAFPGVNDIAYYGDGGLGVGRPEQENKVEDVVGGHDGQQGRRLVRFMQLSFESDATQIDFSPPAYQDPDAFRTEARRVAAARAAAYPDNYRAFLLPGTCHVLAGQPALYQAYERNANGLYRPVVPAVRPNPVLVEGGVSVVDFVRTVTRGSGPFASDLPNPTPTEAERSTECPLPGG